MHTKTDDLVNKNNTPPVTQNDIEIACDRFSLVISRLFDMVQYKKNETNRAERIKSVEEFRDLMDMIFNNLPNEALTNKKGPYDFDDVAKSIAYNARWYTDLGEISMERARLETNDFKKDLQGKHDPFDLAGRVANLIKLAPNEYERRLTGVHCEELVDSFQTIKKHALAFYFNNDPFHDREEINKKITSIVRSLTHFHRKTRRSRRNLIEISGGEHTTYQM